MTTDDLVGQWEPKIHSILRLYAVRPDNYEDFAQELRIVLLRAARNYNSERGASFHTYLHTSLVNTMRSLLAKTGRTPVMCEVEDWMAVTEQLPDTLEPLLRDVEINGAELLVLDMLLCGYSAHEIARVCHSPYRVGRIVKDLRKKLVGLRNGDDAVSAGETGSSRSPRRVQARPTHPPTL